MKENILKIMVGATMLEAFLVSIFIFTSNSYLFSMNVYLSLGYIIGYAIPSFLYSKIADDDQFGKIAIIGAVLAGVTAVLVLLKTWQIITVGTFLIKATTILNVLLWCSALISPLLAFPPVNDLLNLLKKISMILISIAGLAIIIVTLIDVNPTGTLLKIYLALTVLAVGSYISIIICSKVLKKELEEEYVVQVPVEQPVIPSNIAQQPLNQVIANNQVQQQPVMSSVAPVQPNVVTPQPQPAMGQPVMPAAPAPVQQPMNQENVQIGITNNNHPTI